MPHRLEWIDKLSKSVLLLAISFVLCGFRAWGNDYSQSQTLVAHATAEKDRAIIAAIESSRADAQLRERQTQESLLQLIEANRKLIERIDVLTAALSERAEQ